MRDNIIFIYLENHAPSDKARKEVHFWLDRIPTVVVSEVLVNDSLTLKHAKRTYKITDLPCLVDGGIKFYNDGIEGHVKELRDKWQHLKQ